MRRSSVLALAAFVAACSSLTQPDPYPMPTAPGSSASVPVGVGEAAPTVVLFLDPRPGDEFELISAEAVGMPSGADVEFHFAPPVVNAEGDHVIGDTLEDLAGARFRGVDAGADDTVGIVAEVTASEPGRYELASVRLRYRLNGGPEQVGEGISVVFAVCADDPRPADCEPPA